MTEKVGLIAAFAASGLFGRNFEGSGFAKDLFGQSWTNKSFRAECFAVLKRRITSDEGTRPQLYAELPSARDIVPVNWCKILENRDMNGPTRDKVFVSYSH